jgi:hypothetical protein
MPDAVAFLPGAAAWRPMASRFRRPGGNWFHSCSAYQNPGSGIREQIDLRADANPYLNSKACADARI